MPHGDFRIHWPNATDDTLGEAEVSVSSEGVPLQEFARALLNTAERILFADMKADLTHLPATGDILDSIAAMNARLLMVDLVMHGPMDYGEGVATFDVSP